MKRSTYRTAFRSSFNFENLKIIKVTFYTVKFELSILQILLYCHNNQYCVEKNSNMIILLETRASRSPVTIQNFDIEYRSGLLFLKIILNLLAPNAKLGKAFSTLPNFRSIWSGMIDSFCIIKHSLDTAHPKCVLLFSLVYLVQRIVCVV